MLPTLNGRIQTRIFVTAVIGSIWTLIITPILPIDARQLLGVEKDQVVVVRGKGHVDKLGVLVISADGIHVRR